MSNPPNDGNGVPPVPPAQPEPPPPDAPGQPASPDYTSADYTPPSYSPPQYTTPGYTLPGATDTGPSEPEAVVPPAPPTGSAPEEPAPPQQEQGAPAPPAPDAPMYLAPGAAAFPGAQQHQQQQYGGPNGQQGYPGSSVPPYAAPPSQGYPGGPTAPYGGAPYGGVPVSAPQPGKGLAITAMVLGIVGLLGFVVALIPFVGFISLLVPLAAVIIGIVALVRKSPGRPFAITGVITGALALIVCTAIAITITNLVATAANDPQGFIQEQCESAGLTAEECDALATGGEPATDPEGSGSEPGAVPIAVGETAFGAYDEEGEYAWYTVELENPDQVFYEYVYADVEALDANGTILDTSTIGGGMLPGTTVFSGIFSDAAPADIAEIQVVGLDDLLSEGDPFEGGEFTVSDIAATTDDYQTTVTGRIASSFTDDHDQLGLTVVARDADGTIVFADEGHTDRVPAGGSANFEVSLYASLPDGLTFEVHPYIW